MFNPVTQSERFDPAGKFIRRYLLELGDYPEKFIHVPWALASSEQQRCGVMIGRDYLGPIVDHALARLKTLEMFKGLA
ncbi:MAG: FAD-binding domain-containing protein [Gallionella sp.]|nr:FAD-binding domain-containing protein [Gallionella sp.]